MIGTGTIVKPVIKIKEKRAIFVMLIGEGGRLIEDSLPSITAYAKKCGADLILRRHQEFSGPKMFDLPMMEKIAIKDYFQIYDRILYLDSDILITKQAPDLFELYPDDTLLAVDEGQFDCSCLETIPVMQEKLGQVSWPDSDKNPFYFNAGIVMYTKKYRFIFEYMLENIDVWKETVRFIGWTEQSWLNWIFHKFEIPVTPISYKFNYILGFDKKKYAYEIAGDKWLENRFNAYFIHYTGGDQYKTAVALDLAHDRILK